MGAGAGREIIEQGAAELGRRGAGETRAQSARGVGGKGELRHEQQAATDRAQRQVHAAFGIGEHAVVEEAGQQAVGGCFGVGGLHADQHQQAAFNGRNLAACHRHGSLADALEQADHRR